MPTRNYLTYHDAKEFYGMSREVLHVMKWNNKLHPDVFKKYDGRVYVDINYFLRFRVLKRKLTHLAQQAVYFLETFTSVQHSGRIVAALYGGSSASLAEVIRVDLFAVDQDSLTNLQLSQNMLRIFRLYRKIKHLMRQQGLSVEDAFKDKYYHEAKQVFDEIIRLSNGEEEKELTVKDFDKVEDYYNYYEAKLHLSYFQHKGDVKNVRTAA
jgi:hypothetical protein